MLNVKSGIVAKLFHKSNENNINFDDINKI